MRRFAAPARRIVALLLATALASGVVFRRGTDRVAETLQGKGGWDGALCDRYGDLRHLGMRLSAARQMG